MTSSPPVQCIVPRAPITARFCSALLLLLGAWFVKAAAIPMFALVVTSCMAFWHEPSWMFVVRASQYLLSQMTTVVLPFVAGCGFVAAAMITWFRWSPGAVRQLVAAALFFPAFWAMFRLVFWIPDSHFAWRAAAIPMVLIFRSVSHGLADVLSRWIFRSARST